MIMKPLKRSRSNWGWANNCHEENGKDGDRNAEAPVTYFYLVTEAGECRYPHPFPKEILVI